MPAPRDTDTGGPKRRAKARRRRSTPTSRARAQERQYVSQGRAIRHAANQQRATPRKVTPVTRSHPLARQTPVQRARSQQGQYVSQGKAIRKVAHEQRALAKRRGHRARQRYFKGKPAEALQRKIDRGEKALGLLYASDPQAYKARTRKANRNLPKTLLTGGPNVIFQPKQARRFGATAVNVAQATGESPIQVLGTSARVARESVTGIPQGIKELATHPLDAIDAIVQDYEDRYGSVLDNPKKFRERVKTEWGLTPYVFDAAALAGGGGQVAGAVARSSRVGRAAAALERGAADPVTRAVGRAGRATHQMAVSERPALRFSAGREGARPQPRSRNLIVAAGQSGLDRSRAKALTGRTARNQRRALDLEVKAGEVTPKTGGLIGRSLREVGATRTFTGRIARDVGGATSKARIRLLTHQGRAVGRMRDRISKLSKPEQTAVREMAELGVRGDADGLRALQARLDSLDPESPDAAAIRTILADPERHLTPRAAGAVDELRAIQVEAARRDPRVPEATEQLRRLGPQARLLGLKRGPNVERFLEKVRQIEEKTGTKGLTRLALDVARAMPEDRPALAKKLARQIEVQANQARHDITTADHRAALAQAQVEATGRVTTPEVRAARRELAEATLTRDRLSGELKGRRGEGYTVRGVRDGRTFRIAATREALAAAKDRVRSARQAVREAEAAAPVGTEVQRTRAEFHAHQAKARRETAAHVEKFEKATRKVHKKAKAGRKFDPRDLEDYDKFTARVRQAADDAGLAEPAYWKGILEGDLERGAAGSKAVGSMRMGAKPKRTEYRLTEQGRGERDPEVLVRGVEANIKRRFQHELIVRNIETHAFPWSKNDGRGMTIDEIKFYAREHGIDPDSIHIQDTRIVTRTDEADVPGDLREDLTSDSLELIPLSKGLAQNRYLAMPSEVGETLNTAARALDTPLFRAFEVIFKQKPARLMLGALNIPWLGFQVASNAMLTGLGGAVNPLDVFAAQKWFRSLDPEARDAIEAEFGITHGHHMNMDQTDLGETNNRMVAFWRGIKQTKTMRLAHRMNPLDAMFRADETQNNFFRKALFYSKARKAAYRRMGSNWKGIDRGITRLADRVLGKPPDRMMQAIAQHGPEFERTAKHVKDFLGDYISFTPAERFLLSRNIMFYGYLRFSLRFAFYTMPVAHPIMTAMMTDIGRMGSQEIKELFGVPRGYNLPASMGAQTYFGDRGDAKKGTLQSINFGRMNPFLNTVTQMESPSQAFGLVSPLAQTAMDQAFKESSFTGRDWRVRGQPTPGEAERPRNYFKLEDRGRIALRQLLSLGFPYRVAEDMLLEPSQSDDALVFSPRPLQYKDEEASAGVAQSRRRWRQEGNLRHVAGITLPVVPKVTAAPQVIKREMEKEADQANRARGKRKTRRTGSRYGGSSGSRYGGSTGSRYGG